MSTASRKSRGLRERSASDSDEEGEEDAMSAWDQCRTGERRTLGVI
jgi:hypothetical protein